MTTERDEERRMAPLALWRYAHDYLRAAQGLCRQNRISCVESQAPYHVAAQGVEFALGAFLRAKGATVLMLRSEIGHSLSKSMAQCAAHGLPPMPTHLRAAVEEIAPRHQDRQFVYLVAADDMFPDVDPLVDAGVWILDKIVPDVAEHFGRHLANRSSPPTAELERSLRADLSATSDIVQTTPRVRQTSARRPPIQ